MAENIKVTVRVRPLSVSEKGRGSTQSIRRNGNEPQVIVNNANTFTFNDVYMPDSHQEEVYTNTISSLIDKLFEGFNCTVLAYGQTGSGKTYTMGTNYEGGLNEHAGIIPRVIIDIFSRLDQNVDLSATITCSFMELYQEELYDLLSATKKALDIREINKNVEIPSLTEVRVNSPEDTSDCLIQGSARRATGSTAMNETSSRSHAIFTIHLKVVKGSDGSSAVTSKLHLVDLAGSERVNKTKATGERFKEGVKINQGLLCLGNVISALGTGQKTVSYRESKLTRLLQGSLGGNSVTLMIACVSPADYNLDETLSTLRYADRAKQIKNKPLINRDPHSEEIARLNDIILRLRNQLGAVGRSGDAHPDAATLNGTVMMSGGLSLLNSGIAENLKLTNVMLVNEVAALQLQMHQLDTMRDGCVEAVDRLNEQVKELEGITDSEEIVAKMMELKATLVALKVLLNIESDETVWHDAPTRDSLECSEAGQTFMISNQTFTTDMKRLKDELTMKEHLAKKLLENMVPEEESHKMIATFAAKITELEQEKAELMGQQRQKTKPDVAAKLAEERRKRIGLLEKEIEGMRKKVQKHEKLIALHKSTQKSLNSLQTEIKDLKQQKVTLVKNLRKDQEKFRQLKTKSEREMNVMREKEKKRHHELKRIEAQHERQKLYLQRRVEEANIKARRAENLLNKQKRTGGNNKRVSVLKEPAQIEKRLNQELEIIYFVSEVKAGLTVLMEARTDLTNQLKELDGKVPEEATRIALLEAEIEERTHTINDLQQKIQSYDMGAKVETMTKEVAPDEALKIIFESVSDMQEEHYGDKLKWEAAEGALKGQIEELVKAAEEHRRELMRTQKDKQENMALLLDGYLDDDDEEEMEDENEEKKVVTAGPHAENMRVVVRRALEEAKVLREQNEMLKEEMAAAQRIMQEQQQMQGRPKKKNLQQRVVKHEEMAMDSETDADLDNSSRDPDWSFSVESAAVHQRKRRNNRTSKDTSLPGANTTTTIVAAATGGEVNTTNGNNNTTVTLKEVNLSSVSCHCKTHCSRKTCGCRKKGMFCSSKCGCSSCVNMDRGSTSDEQDGASAAVANKRSVGDDGTSSEDEEEKEEEEHEEEEEEQEQDSKRRKLAVNNNENVDMNNTQLKYPYSETKPVFYS